MPPRGRRPPREVIDVDSFQLDVTPIVVSGSELDDDIQYQPPAKKRRARPNPVIDLTKEHASDANTAVIDLTLDEFSNLRNTSGRRRPARLAGSAASVSHSGRAGGCQPDWERTGTSSDRGPIWKEVWEFCHAGLELYSTPHTRWIPSTLQDSSGRRQDAISVEQETKHHLERLQQDLHHHNLNNLQEERCVLMQTPTGAEDRNMFLSIRKAVASATCGVTPLRMTRYAVSYRPSHLPVLQNCSSGLGQYRYDLPPTHAKASGCITDIAQASEFAIVASVSNYDRRTATDSYDGEPASLTILHGEHGALSCLDTHLSFQLIEHEAQPLETQYRQKGTTVYAVKFDPLDPSLFVSAGCDQKVRIWDLRDFEPDLQATGSTEPSFIWSRSYPGIPNAIEFKPAESVFAVACEDGFIYVHPARKDGSFDFDHLAVHIDLTCRRKGEKVGSVLWGLPAAPYLFASSESSVVTGSQEKLRTGTHKAYDSQTFQEAWQFKSRFTENGIHNGAVMESGDWMALKTDGCSLALFTNSHNSGHLVRFYDVARRNPLPTHSINMDRAFRAGADTGIHAASFSPDDIFLAVGKEDDTVNIFDNRFIRDNKAVITLRHNQNCGHEGYGVVGLQWVQGFEGVFGSRLGLVSGGSDGKIRLWDVSTTSGAPDCSVVLSDLDYDVATFTIGDPRKGEKLLLAGDCGGKIYSHSGTFIQQQ